MLGGLLKPGWQNDSAEKRRLAVPKMNAKESSNQAIFAQLALNDPDQGVRLECIKRLTNVESLFRIYQGQSEPQTRGAAKAAFCALIGPNSGLNEAQFKALLLEHNDASVLVAQHCPHVALRNDIFDSLSQIDQANAIADVYYAETRFHLAKQLSQIEALEIARRTLKGKDKKSEKIIRTKLDTFRAQLKLENDINEAALELCEQMEFIANHPDWRSEFKGKYEQYTQRWSVLELKPNQTNISRFNGAKSTAKIKVEKQINIENAEHNQYQIASKLECYCEKLAPLSLTELADEHLSINSVLSEALATWLESSETVPPSPAIAAKFLNAQQALSSLSDLIEACSNNEINIDAIASRLRKLRWQPSYSDLVAKSQASELLAGQRRQNAEQAKQNKDNLDALHKRINRLLGTSNKGDIRKARHELLATTKAASLYEGKERKILDERLEMASEIVSKMSDWQNFAIEPKLIELSIAMEQLLSSKAHPDKLAKEISTLQNHWKSLGHTEISDNHWQRFKTAADQAYAPCAAFFEQRRTTQKDNLAKREPMIAKMQSLLDDTDWDNVGDYKQIEIGLRNIDAQWRKIKDVERKAGQKQWDRLSAIRALIYQKLDIVYDANIELKNQLISQVSAIADGSPNDDSLDKLKLFQSRWQQVGVTRRKQDQEAWKRFRAAGDRLYENVKALRDEKRAHEDEQIGAYKDVIKQIHSLAKSATNLADADAQFEQLSTRYTSLPALPKSLPEKLIERLGSDFRRATDAYSQAHDRIVQASKDQVINALREKAKLCVQLEAAQHEGDAATVSELEQKLEQLEISDNALEKRFTNRLDAVKSTDKSAANKARTLLCIKLEILLGVDSPDEDKALRMQIQLDRMKNAGIGQPKLAHKGVINELTLDWLCQPGADPDLQTNLERRFNSLLTKT